MRYFTADLHIDDKTIARWRGFDDVAEHDDVILAGLCRRVTAEDELWLLGDLCTSTVAGVTALREAIPCGRVHVVVGNHDSRAKFVTAGCFDTVDYYAEVGRVKTDGYKFIMSHYPMLDWDRAYHGSFMLHGHIHSLPTDAESGRFQEGFEAPAVGRVPSPPDRDHGGMCMRGYNAWNREQAIRRFDVGVDANGYRPVSAEELVAWLPSEVWTAAHGLPVD